MDSSKVEVVLEPREKKDFWDIAKILTAGFLIPLLGYFIHASSTAYKMTDSNAQVLTLAVEILKSPPLETDDNRELRSWAVEVVNKYAVIELPESLKNTLEKSPVIAEPSNVYFEPLKDNDMFGIDVNKDYIGNFTIRSLDVAYQGNKCELLQAPTFSFNKSKRNRLSLVSLMALKDCSGIDFDGYQAVGIEENFLYQGPNVKGVTLSITMDYSTDMLSSVSNMTVYFMPIKY